MTHKEFSVQIQRLIDVFGNERWSDARVHTLWYSVINLNESWFKETVNSAILSSIDKFDFLKAIQAEKNRQAMERKANDVIAMEKLSDHLITDEGFQKALKALGADSVLGAFEKLRRIEG